MARHSWSGQVAFTAYVFLCLLELEKIPQCPHSLSYTYIYVMNLVILRKTSSKAFTCLYLSVLCFYAGNSLHLIKSDVGESSCIILKGRIFALFQNGFTPSTQLPGPVCQKIPFLRVRNQKSQQLVTGEASFLKWYPISWHIYVKQLFM